MKNNISAIIITKNEETMIADCLDSVVFCNEILVVDNVSEDRTAEIAKRMGAKVFESQTNNFSALRSLGLKKAKGEWVLYVDADERVTDSLRNNIKYQISNMRSDKITAFKIKRKNFYLGNHEWPYIEHMERIFKRKNLKEWKGELHESPIVDGGIDELDGFLLHYTHRNLFLMVKKTIEWSRIEAQLRFETNHPKITWWRFPRVMITAFYNSYVSQQGWKVGTVGLIESIYQSFSAFITYARLWEMQNSLQTENEKNRIKS